MTSTRPKRNVRNTTPAPPVEDDKTIVHSTLDRVLYAVDVMRRFDRTHEDLAAFHRGERNKPIAQVVAEAKWHEGATQARKECPLGSTAKKRKHESGGEESGEEDQTTAAAKNTPKPKPAPPTPSKAKLALMKKKADAERRKAERDAKKLEDVEKAAEADREVDFTEMPVLEIEDEESDLVGQTNQILQAIVAACEKQRATQEAINAVRQELGAAGGAQPNVNLVQNNFLPPVMNWPPHRKSQIPPDPPSREPCSSNSLSNNIPHAIKVVVPPIEADTQLETVRERKIIPRVPLRVFHPDIYEPEEVDYTPGEVARHPWLAEEYNNTTLYPFEFGQFHKDEVPGRAWRTPYTQPANIFEVFEDIGPQTELMNLDMHARTQLLTDINPDQANLINKRVLELLLPYYRKKLADPETPEEQQEIAERKLAAFTTIQKNLLTFHERIRYRIISLPEKPKYIPERLGIIKYYSFDPTWYSSSRNWCDKSSRQYNMMLHKAFMEQFRETNNTFILQFQKDMSDKAKNSSDPNEAARYRNFRLPVVRNIKLLSYRCRKEMTEFREKLALNYQYEDFERTHMNDPACREILKKLGPLPSEGGVLLDHAIEEFMSLVTCYKRRFGMENPVIPLPLALKERAPTDNEIKKITKRCLADVVDTVVLRELAGIDKLPHRIPFDNNAV